MIKINIMNNYLINKIKEGYNRFCKKQGIIKNRHYLSGLEAGAYLMHKELTKTHLSLLIEDIDVIDHEVIKPE